MSNPSFSNIDRWLFELMEGNLSEEQIAQLEAFLLQHPELDVDRDMWQVAKVDPVEVEFPGQQKLIRRRPVGLYMSLGMASVAAFTTLGILIHSGNGNALSSDQNQISSSDSQGGLEKAIAAVDRSTGHLARSENSETYTTAVANESLGAAVTSGGDYSSQTTSTAEIMNRTNSMRTDAVATNTQHTQSTQPAFTTGAGQAPEKQAHLQTSPPEEITFHLNDKTAGSQRSMNSQGYSRFESSSYKESFSSKMSKMGRAVQRMLDNPVALKNFKDPHYHIPGMLPGDINFGSVGTLLATRVQTMSRLQWAGQDNEQLINSVSIDGYNYGMRGGLGLQINHSYYGNGAIQNSCAALTYSPKFSVTREIIVEPSIRFKMGNKTIDPQQITTGSPVEMERRNVHNFYEQGQQPIGRNLWYKDLGLGLMVNTRWFYAGIQADNLLQHYDNIYSSDLSDPRRAGKHMVITAGTDYQSRKEHFTVSPYLVYQQYESLSEGWLGVNFRYHWITVGGALSSSMEPAASLGLKFDHFMVTYNADYTYSGMLNNRQLSHQLTLRFLTKPSRIGQRLLNL